jgi:CubicO group peptidase (beta-lactamase class C family)
MNMSISEALLKKLQDANIPFASVAVTNEQETIFSEHIGTQIIGEQKVVDSSTIYRIASMTKPIVSLAALLLVQKGSLRLDDYAEDYAPELKDLKVANLVDGEIHYEDAKEKITIHHLLAHTSGFAYDFHDPALTKLLADEKIAPLTDKAGAFIKVPLSYQPGTKWEYGVGLDWMGVIIEKISGQSLNAFIKESIFQPLGMNNSSFDPDDLGKEKLAEMHLMQEAEFIRSTDLFDDSVQDFYSGGGGILSTVEDYCKFMRIFLNDGQVNGQEFLSKELLEKMMTNQAGDLNYDF